MVIVQFYGANITGNTDSDWVLTKPEVNRPNTGWFFIEGTAGGATYTLLWRPRDSSDAGMVMAQYELLNKSTDIMQQVHVPYGELKVTVASGSGINSRPQFLWQ